MDVLRDWIERPQRIWLRRAIFQVHLWSGLGVALYLLVVSVTGSALVFHWEIEAWAAPSPVAPAGARPLDFDALKAAAERRIPSSLVHGFLKPRYPTSAVQTWLEVDGQDVVRFLDPFTGADLGPSPLNGVLEWLAVLHAELLAGHTGLIVNGVGAVCLLLLSLTGLVVWWPGRRTWRRSLTIDPRLSWQRINWDLHSAIGFWTVAIVVIWAVTGIYFAFPETIQRPMSLFMPFEAPREAPPPKPEEPGRPFASLEAIIAAAERATPGAVTTWIDAPHVGSDGRAVVIRHERYEPWASHSPVVTVNAYTAEVEHVDVALRGNTGDTIQRWLGYLHFGNFGGVTVKLLWTVTGLVPALLAVTGMLMWWNRVAVKKLGRRSRSMPKTSDS